MSFRCSKDNKRIYKGIHTKKVWPSSSAPFWLRSLVRRWTFDPIRFKRCNEPPAGPLGKKACAVCLWRLWAESCHELSRVESETEEDCRRRLPWELGRNELLDQAMHENSHLPTPTPYLRQEGLRELINFLSCRGQFDLGFTSHTPLKILQPYSLDGTLRCLGFLP